MGMTLLFYSILALVAAAAAVSITLCGNRCMRTRHHDTTTQTSFDFSYEDDIDLESIRSEILLSRSPITVRAA
jgi:GTPase SAR1 family protein